MGFLGTLTALLSVIASAFLTITPLLAHRGGAVVEKVRREDDVYPCLPIPSDVWLQPDAYLYSQPALMALGIAVTWDNPDVRILDGAGNSVGSHDLLPSTQYRIQATIHNRSAAAPAPGMPVIFAPTGFGAGAPILTPVGTVIDLPVQGAAGEPAIAEVKWTTPATPGHYCIVITAVWPDDANLIDNVGQHNTVIREAAPGQAMEILVPVFGPPGAEATFRATVDAYALPRAPIEAGGAPIGATYQGPGDVAAQDARRLAEIVSANARGRFPPPDAWGSTVTPVEVDVVADGSGEVRFRATVPSDAATGTQQRFNVIVTDAETDRLLGGVTVIVNVV
jgi:hypothetical protein